MGDLRMIRVFSVACRLFFNQNVGTGEVNKTIFIIKCLFPFILFTSTVSGIFSHKFAQDWMEKTQEIIIFINASVGAYIVLVKSKEISALIKMTQIQMPLMKTDPPYAKAFRECQILYFKFGVFVLFLSFILATIVINIIVAPLPNFSETAPRDHVKLAFGSVSGIRSVGVFVVAQIFSLGVFWFLGSFLVVWMSLITFTALKLKLLIGFLIVDIDLLDENAKRRCRQLIKTNQMYCCYLGSSQEFRGSSKKNAKVSRYERLRANKDCNECKKKTMEQCALLLLNKAVQKHVEILNYVTLMDKTYRLALLVFLYSSIFMGVLCIPDLLRGYSSINNLKITVWMAGFVAVPAACNALGQFISDEFKNLRHAIYDCNWEERSISFRKNMVVMQIVANKRQGLSAGGISQLGWETFGNVMTSFYTYSNFLLTMTKKEN